MSKILKQIKKDFVFVDKSLFLRRIYICKNLFCQLKRKE